MALRFCRASVDTPYVLLSTPLMRKLVLSERTDVPRPCEGSKTLHIGRYAIYNKNQDKSNRCFNAASSGFV